MREPTPRPEPSVLEATALRYAARDLSPAQCEAFEARLAGDQSARDALAEAVRLSAAALGRGSPAPDRSLRSLIRERIQGVAPTWLARRVYRGHPLTWAGIGAAIVAAATVLGLELARPDSPSNSAEPAQVSAAIAPLTVPESNRASRPEEGRAFEAVAEEPHDDVRTAAEIWADLSTPEHVEKTHDDEAKLHLRFKNLHTNHPLHSTRPTSGFDSRE